MTPDNETLKATPGQVKYLHVLYRKLYWDEETYRSMLNNNYGVDSTSDLTKAQAFNWIAKLTKVIAQFDDRVTDKQIYLIRDLWKVIDYAKGEEGDVYLNKFIVKFYRKPSLIDLTKQEAIRLVKQIGQMTKQAEERKGKTTVLRRRTKCVHCGKLIMWVQLKDERREAFDCDEANNPTDFHKCR
jgi:hypothetical protein